MRPCMNKNLEAAIKNLTKEGEEELWNILVEETKPQAGPFDGGCLICADAIINAMGEGGLVRIESNRVGVPQTEHYGVTIKGYVYDFNGLHDGPDQWVASFRKEAPHLESAALRINFQHDKGSEIVRDTAASEKIGKLLREEVAKLSEVNVVSFRVETLRDWDLYRDSLKHNHIEYDFKSSGLDFEIQLRQGKTIDDAFNCAMNLSDSQVILDTIRPCPLKNNSLERRYNGIHKPVDWMKFSKGYDTELEISEFDKILAELRDKRSDIDPGAIIAQVNLEIMSSAVTVNDKDALNEIHSRLIEDSGMVLYQGKHIKDSKILEPLKQAIKNIEHSKSSALELK